MLAPDRRRSAAAKAHGQRQRGSAKGYGWLAVCYCGRACRPWSLDGPGQCAGDGLFDLPQPATDRSNLSASLSPMALIWLLVDCRGRSAGQDRGRPAQEH
jgi:hypothetical protein